MNGKIIMVQIQNRAFQMIRNAMIWHFVLNLGDLLTLKHRIFRLCFFCISCLYFHFQSWKHQALEYLFHCEYNIVFLNGDVFKIDNWNYALRVPSFDSTSNFISYKHIKIRGLRSDMLMATHNISWKYVVLCVKVIFQVFCKKILLIFIIFWKVRNSNFQQTLINGCFQKQLC